MARRFSTYSRMPTSRHIRRASSPVETVLSGSLAMRCKCSDCGTPKPLSEFYKGKDCSARATDRNAKNVGKQGAGEEPQGEDSEGGASGEIQGVSKEESCEGGSLDLGEVPCEAEGSGRSRWTTTFALIQDVIDAGRLRTDGNPFQSRRGKDFGTAHQSTVSTRRRDIRHAMSVWCCTAST